MTEAAVAQSPKAGLLSQMAVTWVTALGAVTVGLVAPAWSGAFSAAPSRRLLDFLLISIGIMAAHKIESYFTHEFDHCPVYRSLERSAWAREPRRAVFVAFCSTFIALMFVVALTMRGAPWLLLLSAVWCAQGLHEIHHAAKSVARGRYYSGTATAIAFTAFIDLAFFPTYRADLGLGAPAAWAFYAVQPLLFLAFLGEDRLWLARGGRSYA